jgi:hypothetical protein
VAWRALRVLGARPSCLPTRARWAHRRRWPPALASALRWSRRACAATAPLACVLQRRTPAGRGRAWRLPPRRRSVGWGITSPRPPGRRAARVRLKRPAAAAACQRGAGAGGAGGDHATTISPGDGARPRAGPARAGGRPPADAAARSPALQLRRRLGRQPGHDAPGRARAPGSAGPRGRATGVWRHPHHACRPRPARPRRRQDDRGGHGCRGLSCRRGAGPGPNAAPGRPRRVGALAHAWSQLKPFWRTAKARTRAALEWASQHAWPTLTAADAHGWFTSCG